MPAFDPAIWRAKAIRQKCLDPSFRFIGPVQYRRNLAGFDAEAWRITAPLI
jgi:hypothetical protein